MTMTSSIPDHVSVQMQEVQHVVDAHIPEIQQMVNTASLQEPVMMPAEIQPQPVPEQVPQMVEV